MSTAPLAMKVDSTPIPVRSHSRRSWRLARRRMQPLPAMITGRSAARSRSKARSTILSSGTERRNRRGSSGVASVWCLAMSSGSSMCTAPGFSVRATRTALRTISGMVCALTILVAHFVTREHLHRVHDLVRLLCGAGGSSPARSALASARGPCWSPPPGDEIGGPGPRVPRQQAGWPVSRP